MKENDLVGVYPCFVTDVGIGLIHREMHIIIGVINSEQTAMKIALDLDTSVELKNSLGRMFDKTIDLRGYVPQEDDLAPDYIVGE